MAKKNKLGLEDLGGFVFSTDDEFSFEDSTTEETLPVEEQRLEAHFSNKGRGGKIVTIISGFQGTSEDLKSLAKMLKTKCGVGGTVKDQEILIQGDYREKIMVLLRKEGYKVKRVGG